MNTDKKKIKKKGHMTDRDILMEFNDIVYEVWPEQNIFLHTNSEELARSFGKEVTVVKDFDFYKVKY